MSVVYAAHDPKINRTVAVKVLLRQLTVEPQFLVRFRREAEVIAALEHPAIVPIYDFGEHEGQPFIVMPHMTGGSLAERIAERPLSIVEAAAILNRLASALDEAHMQGIIHRDLKPSNILFDRRNKPYLADFGIVKMVASADAKLTATGSLLGTPAYMSPEQVRGNIELDGRSDIYALGIILFEMLTGNRPYNADTPLSVAMMHVLEPVPRILIIKPDTPVACETVISKALAKERDARYRTAGELAAAVSAIETYWPTERLAYSETAPLYSESSADDDPPSESHRRKKLVWIGGFSGVVILVILLSVMLLNSMGAASSSVTATSESISQKQTETAVPVIAVLPTATVPQTATSTPMATATQRPTSTLANTSGPTFTPTRTPRPTSTPTNTARSTSTLTPIINTAVSSGDNWVRSFQYHFPDGFWTVGSHEYYIEFNCLTIADDSGNPSQGRWTATFQVSEDTLLHPTPLYLRLSGVRTEILAGESVEVINPSQQTVGVLSLAGITREDAELSATDCTATIAWDDGPPQALVPVEPFQQ